MPNISPSKGNQTSKFGQLIENITTEIFFFKNHAENGAGRDTSSETQTSSRLLLTPLFEVKASGLQLSFNLANNRYKIYKTLEY